MNVINIHNAKTNLSKLLKEVVEQDAEIIIGKAGKPIAILKKFTIPEKKRTPGSAKGKIWIADDFNETPEDIINLFYS